MKPLKLLNFAEGHWVEGKDLSDIPSAIDGQVVAQTGSGGLDFAAMADYARKVGGPALRRMTFHERALHLRRIVDAAVGRRRHVMRP